MRNLAWVVMLAACGGDDGGGTTTRLDAAMNPMVDAAPMVDAPPDALQLVTTATCGTEVLTVETSGNSYTFSPNNDPIAVGDIVKFVMPPTHNVAPDSSASMTDPGLRVNFNETKCLQFTAVGAFTFKCTPHGFTGTITVE